MNDEYLIDVIFTLIVWNTAAVILVLVAWNVIVAVLLHKSEKNKDIDLLLRHYRTFKE